MIQRVDNQATDGRGTLVAGIIIALVLALAITAGALSAILPIA